VCAAPAVVRNAGNDQFAGVFFIPYLQHIGRCFRADAVVRQHRFRRRQHVLAGYDHHFRIALLEAERQQFIRLVAQQGHQVRQAAHAHAIDGIDDREETGTVAIHQLVREERRGDHHQFFALAVGRIAAPRGQRVAGKLMPPNIAGLPFGAAMNSVLARENTIGPKMK